MYSDNMGAVKAHKMVIPQAVEKIYPVLIHELGLDRVESSPKENLLIVKGINKIAKKLKQLPDLRGAERWRDYCLGCKVPGVVECTTHREKYLVPLQKSHEEKFGKFIEDVTGLAKLILEGRSSSPHGAS